jgi:hypothetical protein
VAVPLLLVLLGAAVALGAGEAGLRALGYRQPALLRPEIRATYRLGPRSQFRYRGFFPGAIVDFDNVVTLNDLGFHDRAYAAPRPSPMTSRVMVLGDSYVAAFEVALAETFHKRIEARLTREDLLGRGSYEVMAFGQGASAQEAELRWLREFGPQYRPDVVLLLFFCGNDVMENSPVLFDEANRFARFYMSEVVPKKIALFDRLLVVPRSRLNGLLVEAVSTLYVRHLTWFHPELPAEALISPELGVYRRAPTAEWQDAFARTGALLSYGVLVQGIKGSD